MPIEGLLILPAEKGRSRIDRNKQRSDPHLEAVALPMVAFEARHAASAQRPPASANAKKSEPGQQPQGGAARGPGRAARPAPCHPPRPGFKLGTAAGRAARPA